MASNNKLCCSVAVLVSVFVVVAAYFAFHRTIVAVMPSAFIEREPEAVYEFCKNPVEYPRVNPMYKSAEVTGRRTDRDGVEHINATVCEIWPVIPRIFNLTECYPMYWTAMPQDLSILIEFNAKEIVIGRLQWVIAKATKDGKNGTMFTDVAEFFPPWILRSLTEENAVPAHNQLVQNVKRILENS